MKDDPFLIEFNIDVQSQIFSAIIWYYYILKSKQKKAAAYLDISPGTLAVWDCTKRYDLRPIKVGRNVRYRKSDLDRFLDERLKP